MKKSLFVSLVTLLLVFLFSCQQEMPVSPEHQKGTLEKGRPVKVSATLTPALYGFVDIALEWNSIKHAEYYEITYYHIYQGKHITFDLPATATSVTIGSAMLQLSGATSDILIEAYGYRKDSLIVMASSYETFTYTGTGLAEFTITGSLTMSAGGSAVLNIDWNDVTGVTNNWVIARASWGGSITVNTYSNTSYAGIIGSGYSLVAGDFVSVTIEGRNSSNETIAIGNVKLFYSP